MGEALSGPQPPLRGWPPQLCPTRMMQGSQDRLWDLSVARGDPRSLGCGLAGLRPLSPAPSVGPPAHRKPEPSLPGPALGPCFPVLDAPGLVDGDCAVRWRAVLEMTARAIGKPHWPRGPPLCTNTRRHLPPRNPSHPYTHIISQDSAAAVGGGQPQDGSCPRGLEWGGGMRPTGQSLVGVWPPCLEQPSPLPRSSQGTSARGPGQPERAGRDMARAGAGEEGGRGPAGHTGGRSGATGDGGRTRLRVSQDSFPRDRPTPHRGCVSGNFP